MATVVQSEDCLPGDPELVNEPDPTAVEVVRPEGTPPTSYQHDISKVEASTSSVNIFLLFVMIVTFPISLCFIYVVREYERAVILYLGKLVSHEPKGPGLFFWDPCGSDLRVIDLRTVTFDVPPQDVLTKDSVTVQVDAVVYYKVVSPIKSVINVDNYSKAVQLLAASKLRNSLGNRDLGDILTDRKCVSQEVLIALEEATDPWGIEIERVEIKDIRLPVSMQRSMAAEAEATRTAKANIIMAHAEEQASVALKEAADIMTFSPAAVQLRYLQTLGAVAADNNKTIIFPMPPGFLKKWC